MKQVYSTMKKSVLSLTIAAALGMQAVNVQAGDTWATKAAYTRTQVGATGFGTGTAGYLGTGFASGVYRSDLRVYTQSSNTWAAGDDLAAAFPPGNARRDAVAFSLGGNGYLGTGFDGTNYYKDLWLYNTSTNTFTQVASMPAAAAARGNAVGFSIGSKGYVATGKDASNMYNDMWEYNSVSNSWSQKSNFPNGTRYGAVAFSIGNKGYVGTGNNGTPKQDFWEYNQATDSWVQKADFAGGFRYLAVGFSVGPKGYVGTGNDGTATRRADFWEFDPSANTWTARAAFTGVAREAAVGFSVGTKGYIGTGTTNGTTNTSDFREYTPFDALVTLPLSSAAYSPGAPINVYYGAAGSGFNAGNVFNAYLSDASGSFASEVLIGSLTSVGGTGVITSTIPLGTATGSGYRVRVKSTNPVQVAPDNGSNFRIAPSHVTMSLANASQTSSNTLQFDLMVVSDGDASSDLRANAFQYGLDYNTGILPGGTITPSYIAGSSDFIPPLGGFTFPAAGVSGHIRIVENAYTGGNTGNTMIVGHQYKVGRFQLTGSASWVGCSNANFALNGDVVAGKTTSAALVNMGADASSTNSFDQTGTGNLQRSIGSVSTLTLNCITTVNLKLFIEGYYNTGTHAMRPVLQNEAVAGATGSQTDTVRIELHSTSPTSNVVEAHNAIVATNGTVSASFAPSVSGQSLWIAVFTRGALQTWSAAPVTFSSVTNYDFTTAASQAYQSNQVQLESGVFGFYTGDINQDENVDLLDFPLLDYAIGFGIFGYNAGDLNGDGNTDLLDFPLYDNNLISGRYSHHP